MTTEEQMAFTNIGVLVCFSRPVRGDNDEEHTFFCPQGATLDPNKGELKDMATGKGIAQISAGMWLLVHMAGDEPAVSRWWKCVTFQTVPQKRERMPLDHGNPAARRVHYSQEA